MLNYEQIDLQRYWSNCNPRDGIMTIHELSGIEANEVSGGIPWTTAASVALAESASLGPLVWAFGMGFVIGTTKYKTHLHIAHQI
ncbi:hypothetical protein ACFOLJ_03685 [Rugamonas sp. CCM 8940]|uniref:hypothetical protein n=1 Tax=Rugamonas sp. CCM 8940 TaxID=2765359 RepID=UPI0018F4EFC4|nr:hypothetical protein [Rugamonas sp. CCM 8940]MBJ7311289.1 hypothetical protein [Rugamonas sp. CCM 8940]